MATIQKRGKSYKITVSTGYDIHGKQLREYMTWTPEPGMTARQIEKELQRQAVLFEEKVTFSGTMNGNTRLVDFTDIFLKQHARPNLKAKTAFNYEKYMAYINQAIGHIKLKDLKPGHIAAFIANMQEAGMRERARAVCKIDLNEWIQDNKCCGAQLAANAGVNANTIKHARHGNPVSVTSAKKISAAMGIPYFKAFEPLIDDTPLKPKTVRTYISALSAVLSKAVDWGYIERNPVERVDLPSIAGHRAPYLDEPEVRRLLQILQDEPIRWRALVTFDLLSGLRRGELTGLFWSDIDFDAYTLTVRRTANYIPGRGLYLDTPKTITSERMLKLSASAILLLKEYKAWQDHQKELLGDAWEGIDDRVFTTDSGRPLAPDSVSQHFRAFIKRTGLQHITIHSLRHTYASLMISDGTPLVIVANQLGHAQTSTTSNIYAHVISAAEVKALQIFDRFSDLITPGTEEKTEGSSLKKEA